MIPMIRRRTRFLDVTRPRFKNFDDVEDSDANEPLSIFAKVEVKFPSRANGLMQCFILLDTTGSKIEAVAKNIDVSFFNVLLQEGCTYTFHRVIFKISHATEFQNITTKYKCYLEENTTAEPFTLPIQFPPYPKHLIPFPQVFNCPNKSYVDVVGMIVHWGELEYVGSGFNRTPFRDIVIMDERFNMLAISVWAEHLRRYTISLPTAAADNLIIIATMLRNNYKYGCFETSTYTKFAFDPAHHAIRGLQALRRNWIMGSCDRSYVKKFVERRWAYLATIV